MLIAAFIGTGFVSAAYHRERVTLGEQHFADGQGLAGAGDLTGAAEEFRKALLFTPDSREYRLSLATALVGAGKLDEAESHLEQLLQEDPTNGQINLLLARVAQQEHHVEQAIESYQRAVYEYWPPNKISQRRQARWELIHLLEQQKGKRRSELVGELLQLYGNLPAGSAQRLPVGEMLLKNGADSEAAGVFRDVLKSAPQDAEAHRGLATVAFRAGEYVEARHEYQQALRSSPNDQASEKALQLTNTIVDMAPELPNISPAERLRRSSNLLRRVESDLGRCAPPESAETMLNPRLEDIARILKIRGSGNEDAAAQMQSLAAGLWRDRGSYCAGVPVSDPAVEAVLTRLGL